MNEHVDPELLDVIGDLESCNKGGGVLK